MNSQAPTIWFWFVAALGLLWNLAGVGAFMMQITMDLSTLPDVQRNFHESTPMWATAAFAVAVAAGTLGCVALLFRKSWATLIFAVSLAGIVIQISHSLFIGDGLAEFGPQGLVLPALTFLLGVLLLWFAKYSGSRHWIH